MGNPVVVQGVAVGGEPHYNPPPTSHDTNNYGDRFVKGEKQESKCRDPVFAFLMYGNLIAIIVTVIVLKDEAFLILDTNSTSSENYTGYIYAALICGVFAMIFSGIMLIVMMQIPSFLIKTSLIFVVVMSGVWAVMGFIWGNFIMGTIGVVFFLIGICYARAVWSRIPFATANLVTGCTAVRGNCGVIFVTFIFEALAFAWTMLWCLACLATFNSTYSCTENANGQQICTQVNYGYLFLLLLSFYFTHQVIQNTVHVIVAGTVGTWWFSPEDSGCCSSGVLGSTIRYVPTVKHTHTIRLVVSIPMERQSCLFHSRTFTHSHLPFLSLSLSLAVTHSLSCSHPQQCLDNFLWIHLLWISHCRDCSGSSCTRQ